MRVVGARTAVIGGEIEGTQPADRIVMQFRPRLAFVVSFALLAGGIVVAGCASAAPPPMAPSTKAASPPSSEITTSSQSFCDLVCERAQIVPRPADGPDYNLTATANANTVLEAMHDDLLSCYKKRVAANPEAHGFITVDIVIDQDGRVRTVETTGGAILGEGTMGCLVQRIRRASFDPPHGGGTLRIHVPFSLRRVAPGDQSL